MKCNLRDYWDKERTYEWEFNQLPAVGETIERDDVTYIVQRIANFRGKGPTAIVKMIRYRIADTSTQFIHKCPAKKDMRERMSRDDVIKLEEKHGKAKAMQVLSERVKIRALGAQVTMVCPFCKTEFYRNQAKLPNTVQVDGIMKKKRLIKRG